MIPKASITQWREKAPWITDEQVEQDLVLSRILVELFSDPLLKQELAFRGGTALHKLFFDSPGRYSEDIDLVRTSTGTIGHIISAIRNKLDRWLGQPISKRNQGRFTLYYKFEASTAAAPMMRVKIEINTREHDALFGLTQLKFTVNNSWFSGKAKVNTYLLEELLGTKLRALYQRKKGRDLFDLALVLANFPDLDFDKVIQTFDFYLAKQGKQITRAQFEQSLYKKLQDNDFEKDVQLLLEQENAANLFEFTNAATQIYRTFIKKLSGEAWKKVDDLLDLLGLEI